MADLFVAGLPTKLNLPEAVLRLEHWHKVAEANAASGEKLDNALKNVGMLVYLIKKHIESEA